MSNDEKKLAKLAEVLERMRIWKFRGDNDGGPIYEIPPEKMEECATIIDAIFDFER